MADLINRQDEISVIARWIGYLDEDMIFRIQTSLKKVPSAEPDAKTEDVAPVVHSNWRAEYNPSYSPFDPTMDDEIYFCNNCNNKQYKMSNYCPYCGAKMDEEEQDEELH